MQNKVKDDGAERKHSKRERDKMKWCGESQDSHYKLPLTAMPSEKGLSTAVPPPWAGPARLFPRGLETTGEAIKRPLDPSALVLVLVATVPSSQEIKHSIAPR